MQNPCVLLIVEDNSDIRRFVADALKDEGCKVIEASNGEQGLAALSAEQPSLILLDLQMPVMNGWTFMRQLKERALHVPVIIMSGQRDWVRQFIEIGAADYLDKPIDVPKLIDKVAQYHR
jgi:DNA-binding response OmpR family regulator